MYDEIAKLIQNRKNDKSTSKNYNNDDNDDYAENEIGVEEYDDNLENENIVNDGRMIADKVSTCFSDDIIMYPLDVLIPYKSHTFNVTVSDDLIESIKKIGIIEPLLICKSDDYNKYEIVSGHRRYEAAKELKYKELPCRVAKPETPKNVINEIMVITNLQRRNNFTKMELAKSLKILNDSRKKQGYRNDVTKETKNLTHTHIELTEEFGITKNQMYMLLSFANLVTEFGLLVDNGKITDSIAYNISRLSPEEQIIVYNIITQNNIKLTTANTEMLLKAKTKGLELDESYIYSVLTKTQENKTKLCIIKLTNDIITKYNLSNKTSKEINEIVTTALKIYYENDKFQ